MAQGDGWATPQIDVQFGLGDSSQLSPDLQPDDRDQINQLAAQVLKTIGDAARARSDHPANIDYRDMPGPENAPGDTRMMTHPGSRGTLLPIQIPEGGFKTEPWTAGRFWERAAVPGILYEPFELTNKLFHHFMNGGDETDDAAVDQAFKIAVSLMGGGGQTSKMMSREAKMFYQEMKGLPDGFATRQLPDGTWLLEGPNITYFASDKKEAMDAAKWFAENRGSKVTPSQAMERFAGDRGPNYHPDRPGARSLTDDNAPKLSIDPDGNVTVVGPGAIDGSTTFQSMNFGQGAAAKDAAEEHLKKLQDKYLFGDLNNFTDKVIKELSDALEKQDLGGTKPVYAKGKPTPNDMAMFTEPGGAEYKLSKAGKGKEVVITKDGEVLASFENAEAAQNAWAHVHEKYADKQKLEELYAKHFKPESMTLKDGTKVKYFKGDDGKYTIQIEDGGPPMKYNTIIEADKAFTKLTEMHPQGNQPKGVNLPTDAPIQSVINTDGKAKLYLDTNGNYVIQDVQGNKEAFSSQDWNKVMKAWGDVMSIASGKATSKSELLDTYKTLSGKDVYYYTHPDGSYTIEGPGLDKVLNFPMGKHTEADKAWQKLFDYNSTSPKKTIKDPNNPYNFPADYMWAQSPEGQRTLEQVGGKVFTGSGSGVPTSVEIAGHPMSLSKFLYKYKDDPDILNAIKLANENHIKSVQIGDDITIRLADPNPKTAGGTVTPVGIKHKEPDLPTEQQIMYWPDSRKIQHIGPNENYQGPVLAFHGTDKDFAKMDITKSNDFGIHFGTPQQAGRRYMSDNVDKLRNLDTMASTQERLNYAEGAIGGNSVRIFPAILKVKKTMTMPDLGSWRPEQVARQIEKVEPKEAAGFEKQVADVLDKARKGGVHSWDDLKSVKEVGYNMIRSKLNEMGYDSVRYQNTVEGKGWSYIMWRPGTVRSATNPEGILFTRGHPALTLGVKALSDEQPKPGERRLGDATDPDGHP